MGSMLQPPVTRHAIFGVVCREARDDRAGVASAIVTRNWEFLGHMGQMVILVGLIAWADRRAGFSAGAVWMR